MIHVRITYFLIPNLLCIWSLGNWEAVNIRGLYQMFCDTLFKSFLRLKKGYQSRISCDWLRVLTSLNPQNFKRIGSGSQFVSSLKVGAMDFNKFEYRVLIKNFLTQPGPWIFWRPNCYRRWDLYTPLWTWNKETAHAVASIRCSSSN